MGKVTNFSIDLSFLKIGFSNFFSILKKDLGRLFEKLGVYSVVEIPYGVQFRLDFQTDLLVVNLYSSGRINFQTSFDFEKLVFGYIEAKSKELAEKSSKDLNGRRTVTKNVSKDVVKESGVFVNSFLKNSDSNVVSLKGIWVIFFDKLYSIIDKYLGKIVYESYVIGADEAGKGEMEGALVLGMVGCSKNVLPFLVMAGVSDSKRASRRTRRLARLEKIIKKLCDYRLISITPTELLNTWEKGNLNIILEDAYINLLKKFLEQNYQIIQSQKDSVGLYIDQFSSNLNRFKEKINRTFFSMNIKDYNLVLRHKAEVFPHVAAASILAKLQYEKSKNFYTLTKPWRRN